MQCKQLKQLPQLKVKVVKNVRVRVLPSLEMRMVEGGLCMRKIASQGVDKSKQETEIE